MESSERWNGNNIHGELNTYYWYKKFNTHNNWRAKYFNSQTNSPLTAEFIKENNVVKVQFTEFGNLNKYLIKLSFNPSNSKYSKDKNNWILVLETKDFIDAEKELEKLLI